MVEEYTITVEAADQQKRIDAFLAAYLQSENVSRAFIQKLIESEDITVNEKSCKVNYKLKKDDVINIMMPVPEDLKVEPENIPLDIVYQDSDIIIINKPRGMVVHPAPGNTSGTLVNALLYSCKDLSDINGVVRPGIVHRIDKDTTGLIAVAKNNVAHAGLSQQLSDHTMNRRYLAVVEGEVSAQKGIIDAPIGRSPTDRKKMCVSLKNSKNAVTHYEVKERFKETTLVECRLETGRTHQIRVHMAYIGHPVTGDPVYGKKNSRGMAGQALHAYQLELIHPRTGEKLLFTAEIPEDLRLLTEKCREQI